MTTLAEHMIVAGAENRPPMLDMTMYNSWQSCMLLYIKGKKKDDYDVQATNIVLQGLPPDVYSLVNYRDDPIAFLNKAIAFMSSVMALRFPSSNNQLRTSSNPRNQVPIKMACQLLDEEQLAFLADPGVAYGQDTQTIIIHNAASYTDDLDAYDSNCDDISSTKVILMANLSSYDSEVLSKITQHDTYQNDDMINQSVQETQYFKQSHIDYMSEKMSNHVTNWDKVNQETKTVKESLTVELERYEERVKLLNKD
ncbi:hypothetical protein Tco_1420750 [Tanacetum coccineum]